MSYRVLHDHDDHFVVHDGAGAFRVAKAGLGKATLAKIQSFAEGGEVQEPEAAPLPEPVVEEDPFLARARYLAEVERGRAASAPVEQPSADEIQAAAGRAANLKAIKDAVAPLADRALPEEARSFAPAGSIPEEPKPSAKTPEPEKPEPAPAAPAPAVPQAPAKQQTAIAQAAPRAAPEARPDALESAQQQEARGIAEKAAVAGQEAAAVADITKQREVALSDIAKGFQSRMDAHQKRIDQLRHDILTSKVDPNRYRNSMSESQKTMAAIAIMLGSNGSGTNRALDILQKEIDRDIDAQKANLGIKQSLLSSYLEQGRDMREAHGLAKADLIDVTSAQIQRAAAQYGGPKAQAEATAAIAAAQKQSFQLRQEAELRHAQIQMARVDLGLKAQQMAYMRRQMEFAQAMASGARVDNVEFAGEDMRSRAGTLPDGRKVLAKTPKGAEAIDAASMAKRELSEIMAEMRKFREEEGRNFVPGTAAARKAEALHLRALKAFAGTAGVANYANLPTAELEQFKGVVPDPGTVRITDAGFAASLEQMEQEARQRLSATLGTHASGYVPQQVGRK